MISTALGSQTVHLFYRPLTGHHQFVESQVQTFKKLKEENNGTLKGIEIHKTIKKAIIQHKTNNIK